MTRATLIVTRHYGDKTTTQYETRRYKTPGGARAGLIQALQRPNAFTVSKADPVSLKSAIRRAQTWLGQDDITITVNARADRDGHLAYNMRVDALARS